MEKLTTMRCMAIEQFGGPDKLRAMTLPRPRPAAGEVLLRVVAAGVCEPDLRIRSGDWQRRLPHAFPLIPGWSVAGVVEEFGSDATRFRRGDRVWAYARKAEARWGGYAEYVGVPGEGTGPMPRKLLFEEAAPVPLAGLTALQALFGSRPIAADQFVLVHGAAGGIGHIAVQLAAGAGARVVATAPAQHQAFVLGLGAIAVIDPSLEPVAAGLQRYRPAGADVVLDTVGSTTLSDGLSLLAPGGRWVGTVDEPDFQGMREDGRTAELLIAEADLQQLSRLADEVDRGKLKIHVERILPLGDVAAAHESLEAGTVRGSLVLNL